MKKMYNNPQTETISVLMDSALCSASKVGFGNGPASGAGLAPGRLMEDPNL